LGVRSVLISEAYRGTHPHPPHRSGHVEDAADVERGVGAVVQRVAWLVIRLRHVAVELLVLPLTDLLGLHRPEGLHSGGGGGEGEGRETRAGEGEE